MAETLAAAALLVALVALAVAGLAWRRGAPSVPAESPTAGLGASAHASDGGPRSERGRGAAADAATDPQVLLRLESLERQVADAAARAVAAPEGPAAGSATALAPASRRVFP